MEEPDGDTVNYYELEANPLGTVFDLMLPHTYRDGGPAIIAWDIAGLKLAVDVRATLDKPGDKDEAWTVEMAMPWRILWEASPGRRPPRAGEQWRVNFSRVEWPFVVKDGRYARQVDPATGKPVPSSDSTWSPQGFPGIHMPERWGFVQFSPVAAGSGTKAFVEDPNDRVTWALRRRCRPARSRWRAWTSGRHSRPPTPCSRSPPRASTAPRSRSGRMAGSGSRGRFRADEFGHRAPAERRQPAEAVHEVGRLPYVPKPGTPILRCSALKRGSPCSGLVKPCNSPLSSQGVPA